MELVSLILVVGYGLGMWKFWSGFDRTNFQRSLPNRLSLALLWPVLFTTSKSYRQNFRKALKGRS
jgi:Na+/alanine symporter